MDTTIATMQASQLKAPDLSSLRNQERIEEAAREFEAVFIAEMMKPMFAGIETNEMFGGGKGEEIFRGMMIQEIGKNIASTETIGIQSQVKNKLIELQAAQSRN